MKISRPSSPICHDEDELRETKRSDPRRYHYEYELSEDDNSVVDPPPKSTVLDLVSIARINFRVNYILRLSSGGGDVDETLDSVQMCFYIRLYLITGVTDFSHRLIDSNSMELSQLRGDMLYDVNLPEVFLIRFLDFVGVQELDVMKKLIGDTNDFVSGKNNRVVSIAVAIKVYTLQQEDETIDDARRRAITFTTNLVGVDSTNQLIKLLERPPPYKFMIEYLDDDHEMLGGGDCCICLSKLSVGEEVLFLSCLHPYHYDCVIPWLQKGKQCPLCRCPTILRKFMECFQENLKLQNRTNPQE